MAPLAADGSGLAGGTIRKKKGARFPGPHDVTCQTTNQKKPRRAQRPLRQSNLISAFSACSAVFSHRLPLRAARLAGRPHFRLRQGERDVLARGVAAADRADEVLAA